LIETGVVCLKGCAKTMGLDVKRKWVRNDELEGRKKERKKERRKERKK